MSKMETKLQKIWGMSTLTFCKKCGVPAIVSRCDHDDAAPWSELGERQRVRVRLQAMRKVKAERLAQPAFTVAS